MREIIGTGRPGKRAELLHALRNNPGASRTQLARALDVSIGTVRLLTEELVADGLLTDQGVNLHTGGRPATRLAINAAEGLVLGVDLAEVDIRLALYDLAGALVGEHRSAFRRTDGEVAVDQVRDEVSAMISRADAPVRGVGMAVPGQLDLDSGTVIYSTNLGWEQVGLQALVADATGLPVIVERNSTAGMLAELWWGDHTDHEVSIYITMGSGVGASIRYRNEIFQGESGLAGELGHVVVDPLGPDCRCGRRGCLETFASTRAIQQSYDNARGRDGLGTDLLDGLAAQDPLALAALRGAGTRLAAALASLVNLLNPGLVILSGQLMSGTGELVPVLEEAVRSTALPLSARDVRVVPSALGEEGMLIGAATLVLDAIYRDDLTPEVVA